MARSLTYAVFASGPYPLSNGMISRSTFPSPASISANTIVATSAGSKVKAVKLCEWLHSKGVLSSSTAVKPEECEQGLGLFAQRAIGAGEELFGVPEDLWLNVASAHASPFIGSFCRELRPWVALALFLLFEKQNPDSKWRPYIDSLPECLDSPLFWSEEELAELQGTQLLGSIIGYRQRVESEYEKLHTEVLLPNSHLFKRSFFSMDAFMWAFGILRSRTFPPLTRDDLALVPLADLVNHGLVANMEGPSWEKKGAGFFSHQQTLTLRASVAVPQGKQVFIQYGKKKSNGELALDYGFVERAPNVTAVRDAFMLTLELPESDRFFVDKLDIVELNGLNRTGHFDLVLGQPLPNNMLPFLRLAALGGPDAFLLEALFRNTVWDHLMSPVSKENEEEVCRVVLDGCKAALAAFTTTTDEDLSLLTSGDLSKRMEMAVVIRMGEKKVLQELQAWFELQLGCLDQLEYYAEKRLRSLGLLDDKGKATPWVFNG